jgi:hypothetical protein
MGYMHYFMAQTIVPEQHWTALIARVTTLLEHLPEHAPGPYEAKLLRITWEDDILLPPEVSKERIHFNGACIHEAYTQSQLPPTDHLMLLPESGPLDHEETMRAIMLANGVDPEGLTYFDDDQWDEWLASETFHLYPDLPPGESNGCKTNLKPYDLVVRGVLILANQCCPNWLAISSDGEEGGWENALIWVRSVFADPTIALPNFR